MHIPEDGEIRARVYRKIGWAELALLLEEEEVKSGDIGTVREDSSWTAGPVIYTAPRPGLFDSGTGNHHVPAGHFLVEIQPESIRGAGEATYRQFPCGQRDLEPEVWTAPEVYIDSYSMKEVNSIVGLESMVHPIAAATPQHPSGELRWTNPEKFPSIDVSDRLGELPHRSLHMDAIRRAILWASRWAPPSGIEEGFREWATALPVQKS